MTEILTESFCERCGTRYTFESAVPSQRRLAGLKVLGRGLKNFVMSDDASLDEAMSAARSDVDRDATNHQLDAFHRTFSFCMSCRQYTCANCWNETEARCLSCEPLAIDLAAAEALPDIDIDPARLLRLMGGTNGAGPGHEHVEAIAPAAHEHEHEYPQAEAPSPAIPEQIVQQSDAAPELENAEAPAAVVQDPWPTTPAAPVSWPEGFVGTAAFDDEAEAALTASSEPVREPIADIAPTLADAPVEVPADTAPVEWWAQAEVVAAEAEAEVIAEPEVVAAEPEAEVIAAEPEVVAAEPEALAAEPEAVEPIAAEAALSDALTEYEAAFSAPIPAPEIVDASNVEAIEDGSQAAAAELPAPELPVAGSPTPAPEALPEPVFSEPEPRAVIDVAPAAEPSAAAPAAELDVSTPPAEAIEPVAPVEPVAATPAAAPETPAAPPVEPSAPTDHVAQPVWPAPTDPASPAPQWPTGPRWPTGIPTGGAPSSLPPPVDALAALMARNSTEAMWAASSLEILQPAAATPAVAAIQSCGNCGISLSATARFCRRCGTPQG